MQDVGTVQAIYTNGAGNNIFQYVFSRLLAERHGMNFSSDALPFLDIQRSYTPLNPNMKTIKIGLDEMEYHKYFEGCWFCNFIVCTYGEDYTLYKPHIDRIRSWFADVPKTNMNDLIFQLRLGERLVSKRDHDPCMRVEPKEYIDVFRQFDYEKLHIYTDMKMWRHITAEEVEQMKFHISVPVDMMVTSTQAADYFNSLVDAFSNLNPIVDCRSDVKVVFNAIRSFDKIMFQHGTLAWWAAALSYASKVGVFGPWRPIKGNRNKNLGRADFAGWFQWGNNRIK
jgi:hypothetical protein